MVAIVRSGEVILQECSHTLLSAKWVSASFIAKKVDANAAEAASQLHVSIVSACERRATLARVKLSCFTAGSPSPHVRQGLFQPMESQCEGKGEDSAEHSSSDLWCRRKESSKTPVR